MVDVVYLKNGGIVRGKIIEQVPNTSLKIQTRDKSVFHFQFSEIEKYAQESGSGSGEKKPVWAWLWSFLWTGAGQIYNGQTTKGVLMLVGGIVLHIVSRVFNGHWQYDSISASFIMDRVLCFGSFILATGIWIWSQIDAPIFANKLNNR